MRCNVNSCRVAADEIDTEQWTATQHVELAPDTSSADLQLPQPEQPIGDEKRMYCMEEVADNADMSKDPQQEPFASFSPPTLFVLCLRSIGKNLKLFYK